MNHAATLDRLSSFVLLPSQWDANAEAWAKCIPCDNPGEFVRDLGALVESGRAKLCKVVREGAPVGFIVFEATERHELLIHAAFARDSRESMLPGAFPLVDKLARAAECNVVRFHTMRPGLVRQAQANGFRVSEVIMRRDVRHG